MMYSRIAGTGSYLPAQILTNKDLETKIDTTDHWIVERTGIRSRHIAASHESASSMAAAAAKCALDAAGITPTQLDLIIVATSTPDLIFPSTACLVQELLGTGDCAAFDITAACAGYVYAMSIADQYIRGGIVKNALIIGSEITSRMVDWTDRGTCILFGDGAGATVLTAADKPGIRSTHLHADGRLKDLLYIPSNIPQQRKQDETATLKMQGNELFKAAINILSDAADEILAANGIDHTQIDWLIPHQANIRIIHFLAKKLHLPMDHVIQTIETQGNTSAASIPLALDQGIRSGKIQRGETLLLEGFGGGMAWGTALITY